MTEHAENESERHFFAATSEAAFARDGFFDLGTAEHDVVHRDSTNLGKRMSVLVLAAGLPLIGGFFLYNKVLMPSGDDPLAQPLPLTLPTPEIMREAQPAAPAAAEANTMAEPVALTATAPASPAEVVAPAPRQVLAPAPPESAAQYEALLAEARKAGMRRAAEGAYLAALRAQPRGDEAMSGLALVYLNQHRNEEARARASDAVAIARDNAQGWIVLGAARDALGDFRGAREAYRMCAGLPDGRYAGECKRMLR